LPMHARVRLIPTAIMHSLNLFSDMKDIGFIEEYDEDRRVLLGRYQFTDIIRATFIDHRLVTVARSTKNTFCLVVENPSSSGRGMQAKIHLTEASMLSLMATIIIYYNHKKIDVEQLMKVVNDKEFQEYEYMNANDVEDEK